MIKKTQWKPDTCPCKLEYEWDDSLDEQSRTHSISKIIQACPAHQALPDIEHFNKVVEENTRKNKVYGILMENFVALTDTELDEDGNSIKKLKKGVKFNHQYDKTRKLKITITNAQPNDKSQLQTLVDNEFGIGKVEII